MNLRTSPVCDGGILHDIRNLLTVISVNCDLIAGGAEYDTSELMEGITEAAAHLQSLLRGLQPSRSERSYRDPLKLHEMINQVVGFSRSKHPRVNFRVCVDRDLRVPFDSTKILRCLMNLVENSSLAAEENHSVHATVEVHANYSEARDRLILNVVDSGRGFSQQDPLTAFEPGVSERSNRNGHEGLGLYIVKCIVDELDGHLFVDRKDNQTFVRLEFPTHHW